VPDGLIRALGFSLPPRWPSAGFVMRRLLDIIALRQGRAAPASLSLFF